MSIFYSVVVAVGLVSADPREFYAAANGIIDASFTFEGEFGSLDKGEWVPNTTKNFVGKGAFHRDGVLFLEWQQTLGSGLILNRVSVRDNAINLKEVVHPGLPPRQTEGPGSFMSINSNTETFATVWPACMFYGISNKSRSEWHDEGDQTIDGIVCRVFAWKGGTLTWRWWLDPSKGGNAVRFEKLNGEHLRMRTGQFQFSKIRGKDGKEHVVPVAAVSESYWDTNAPKEKQYRDTPVTRTTCRIVPTTIILNSGRSADSYELKKSKTAVVIDQNAKNPTPPTDVPKRGASDYVKPINDPAVAAANEQKLLDAMNKPKPSGEWGPIVNWVLAGAGLAALCIGAVLYFRK